MTTFDTALDTLHKAGWSYGYVKIMREDGTEIWRVDASKGERKVVVEAEGFSLAAELACRAVIEEPEK